MDHLQGAATANFLAGVSVGRLQGAAIANFLAAFLWVAYRAVFERLVSDVVFPLQGPVPPEGPGLWGQGHMAKEMIYILWRAFGWMRPYVFGVSVLRIFMLTLFLLFSLIVAFPL